MNAIDYAEKAKDLFVLSESFIRIKELINEPSSTIDDISEVILLDPALTAAILKLANSSFFNYPGKIETISKAVLVLGVVEVYNVVIAYSCTEAFKLSNADDEFLAEFWSYSIDTALIIKYLAIELKLENAERLFILGLLHNLGELVVYQFLPEEVIKSREKALAHPPYKKQLHLLGFTYGECSAELMKLWQLPYNLIEPIREQDNSDFVHSADSQLLFIAKRLAFKTNHSLDKPLSFYVSANKLSEFGITEEQANAAISFSDMERLAILAILNPSSAMIY